MPTIRERFVNLLLKPELNKLKQGQQLLWNAYLDGPYQRTPDDLIRELQELDSSMLTDLVDQALYDRSWLTGYQGSNQLERWRAVDESRRLYKYDTICSWGCHLWTDFGFGETIDIEIKEKKTQEKKTQEADVATNQAQDAFDEFWNADRNVSMLAEDELQFLSEDLLVDGEKFLAYWFSTLDGLCTLREFDCKEIEEIVYDPEDANTALFYKRTFMDSKGAQKTLYYPDAMAVITGGIDRETVDPMTGAASTLAATALPRGSVRADTEKEGTTVFIQHIAHNRKGDKRGWPLVTTSAPWIRAHKGFRQDRASVARLIAMTVNKVKTQGGTRGVDAIRSQIQSTLSSTNMVDTNPPHPPGWWVENQAANLERMPLTTGAGDAKTDGESLSWMAALGMGLFPHYMGEGDAYRLATSVAMETPILRQFSRYLKFWSAQFRKMVRYVLWGLSEYGGQTFPEYTVEVSTDKLLDTDLGALTTALGNLFANVINPNYLAGTLPDPVVEATIKETLRLVLSTAGVANAGEILTDEMFNPPEEPNPADVAAEVKQLTSTIKEAMEMVEAGNNGHGNHDKNNRS